MINTTGNSRINIIVIIDCPEASEKIDVYIIPALDRLTWLKCEKSRTK